jgi:hypothetical protein
MVKWFAEYKDVIAGFAGIATAIGLAVTSAALVVAAFQIRGQRQLNRASAVYEIQRDAWEFTWQLISDPILARAVYGKTPDKERVAVATAINYYSAAFQMWQYRVLDSHLWGLLASDLAKMLLKSDQLHRQWDETKANFDPRFVHDMEPRITRESTREEP